MHVRLYGISYTPTEEIRDTMWGDRGTQITPRYDHRD